MMVVVPVTAGEKAAAAVAMANGAAVPVGPLQLTSPIPLKKFSILLPSFHVPDVGGADSAVGVAAARSGSVQGFFTLNGWIVMVAPVSSVGS